MPAAPPLRGPRRPNPKNTRRKPMRKSGALAFLCALVLPLPLLASDAPGRVNVPASVVRGGFGGSVVVGDGEVFVGEAQNLFRAGTVYIYRRTANGWTQAAKLHAP